VSEEVGLWVDCVGVEAGKTVDCWTWGVDVEGVSSVSESSSQATSSVSSAEAPRHISVVSDWYRWERIEYSYLEAILFSFAPLSR
jgi:hypothetical protein